MFTDDTWEYYFFVDVLSDLGLLAIAVFLVTFYSYFVLGGCSPIHCRSRSALVGTMCVFLATSAGYAVAFGTGQKISQLHNLLPFMILGIGVDDMFVIVSSIDQSPQHLSANDRFKIGLAHAGPSITITLFLPISDFLSLFMVRSSSD